MIQHQKLVRLFHVMDTNRNGYLERDDYEQLVARMATARGWTPGSPEHDALRGRVLAQWAAIAAGADPPGSGRVHVEGWLALWNAVLNAAYEERVRGIAELIWDAMDRDGDGRITRDESLLWHRGYGSTDEIANAAFDVCDQNQDGHISRAEWLTLIDQFFLSMTPADPGTTLFGPLETEATP